MKFQIKFFIQQIVFRYVVFKMTAILCRPHWVNTRLLDTSSSAISTEFRNAPIPMHGYGQNEGEYIQVWQITLLHLNLIVLLIMLYLDSEFGIDGLTVLEFDCADNSSIMKHLRFRPHVTVLIDKGCSTKTQVCHNMWIYTYILRISLF